MSAVFSSSGWAEIITAVPTTLSLRSAARRAAPSIARGGLGSARRLGANNARPNDATTSGRKRSIRNATLPRPGGTAREAGSVALGAAVLALLGRAGIHVGHRVPPDRLIAAVLARALGLHDVAAVRELFHHRR